MSSPAARTLGHQLDLFSPRTTPVFAEQRPETPAPVDEPPAPVLPGQTSIFETRELRLGPVSRELMLGRFDEAAIRCAATPREQPLSKAIGKLAAHWSSVTSPEDLLSSALTATVDDVTSQAVAPLKRALETGLLLRTAALLLAHGPAVLHGNRLAADLLREAGQYEGALEAYHRAEKDFPGRARVGRANVLTALARHDEARVLYREAFLKAPEEAARFNIDAPDVQDLVDEIDDLEDDTHPRWVPLLGGLPVPESRKALWTAPRPDEAIDGTLRDFVVALQAARTAATRDGASRRPLKLLAPRLFQLLLARGQC